MDDNKLKKKQELLSVIDLIQNYNLKIKQARFFDRTVDYFRGDNFHEIVLALKDEILKKLASFPQIKQLQKIDDSIQLGNVMIEYKLMIPLGRDQKFQDELNKKYPKHLLLIPPKSQPKMQEKGFYMFNLERQHKKLALLLILVIIGLIGFMLFNIWPLWMKIGLWYISFYFLILMVGFIIFRAFVWFTFFLMGVDFWIFPNFFNDDVEFFQSFVPLYQIEKRNDDIMMIVMRIASALGLICLLYMLAQEPSNIDNITNFTNDNLNDLFNWGNDRFVMGRIADSSNSTQRKKTAQEIFMEAILDDDKEEKQETNNPEEEYIFDEQKLEDYLEDEQDQKDEV